MKLDFQKRITNIFDFAYANSSIRIPATTCREVGKILHAGMYAEEVDGKIPAFSFSASTIKKLNGSRTTEANEVGQNVVFLFQKMNEKWGFYESTIEFEFHEIAFIVGQLSGLHISDPEQDLFGDALEIFRSTYTKQEGGQFFTDQKVTRLAIKMLRFNPLEGHDLVDICAGTGGFLLAGFNRIKELVQVSGGTEQQVAQLAARALKGKEIDTEVAALGNSTITARTGLYSVSIIEQGNSLAPEVNRSSDSRIKDGSHFCLATNPPFGAKIPVRDESILAHYELAKITGKSAQTFKASGKLHGRSPDILFMEKNIKLLKRGCGRAAIVTPYQILSGPQSFFIRDWILRHAIVEAVVDLPGETFQPHTGTKTSLLLVRRRERPLIEVGHASDEPVFMATPKWIGHDRRGKPVYKTNPDGKITDEILTDFDRVEEAFNEFVRNQDPSKIYAECFAVDFSQIKSDSLLRLNAQSYKPTTHHNGQNVPCPASWKSVKLGDVVKRIFYPGRFKRNYVEPYLGAIPFLGGSNISEMISSTEKWLHAEDPRLKELEIRAGWLLVTRSGTTGIISSVPDAWDGFAMSEHVIRIVPDPEKLDPFYLLAFLRTKICQEHIKKGVFGSVIDEISPEFISSLRVSIPTDARDFRRISGMMRAAEHARNAAIGGVKEAVESLESLLG
jgi:type I restriction enzyme M protein